MNASRPRHIVTLDALRGIGAVTVLLVHTAWLTHDRSLAPFGYLAVDFFFILSGFVISRAYEVKLLADLTWRRFMLLRFARLYPSMFLAVVVGLVAHFVLPAGTYRLSWYSAAHLFLLPDLTAREGIFPLNGVLWTLFFEFLINAIHGLVVRWLTTLRVTLFVLAMAGWWIYAAMASGNWGGGWNRATFLSGFARIGWAYGAGILLHRITSDRIRIPAIVPIALALVVFLGPGFIAAQPRVLITLFLVCPLIVALAAASEIPAFGDGFARWIGAISYPLYAIHHPLLFMMATRVDTTSIAARALVVVSIVIIATLVEYGYDVPVRRRLLAAVTPAVRPSAPVDVEAN